MPKFLHAADLHIDSPLEGLERYPGAPVTRIRQASRRAMENLVALAVRERVSFVLIAGDVYDVEPLFETSLFFLQQMQALAKAGIPCVIVLGNHDHAGIAPRNLRMPEGVTVLPSLAPSTVSPAGGVVVHGQSYPRQDCDDNLAKSYPRAVAGALNIGLLHTALTDTQHLPYAPTTPQELAAHGYAYWALGHVHRTQLVVEGGARISFPGNLQGRHARETGPKGALLVEYEGQAIGEVTHVPLDVMRWHHVEVEATSDAKNVVEASRRKVLAATAPDRDAQKLCAVRVTATVTPSATSPLITSGDLREELLGGALSEAGGELWLEKVSVNVAAGGAFSSELAARLDGLARTLAGDAAVRGELAGIVEDVRKELRRASPTLVRGGASSASRAESLVGDGRSMSESDAERLLARAMDLLRREAGI